MVEDSATLAEALVFALGFEEGIEPLGVASTITRALEMVAAEQPDVVLMDVHLPDGNGLDAAAQVVALRPGTPVIIMTAHADQLVALRAAEAGATGFLLKDVRIARIAAGIRQAAAGALAVDPPVLEQLLAQAGVSGPDTPSAGASGPALSSLERDVVGLLAEGLDTPAIAARLGLETSDIQTTAADARSRLGARSNLEAVVRAARAGLLNGVPGGGAR